MTIIINHKQAVLKKGSSFEFVSENRFFTDADAYSFSITFPLKGCPRNQDIFGHINRKDHDLDRLLLDCEIHDRNFHAVGSVSIVSITEVEVKTQFLAGRSAQNFHSDLDDIYINEITMPSLHFENRNTLEFYCRTYAEQLQRDYLGFVGLPWVNNTSGNIQNPLRQNDRKTALVYDTAGYGTFVGQPFLLEVLKQVLTAAGYSYNIEILEDSKFADIIICNALPQVWEMDAMNLILPHWTVSEFLKQLELFLDGQFNLEPGSRIMTFTFNSTLLSQMKEVVLNNVVETHTVDITEAENSKDIYHEQRNLSYAAGGHQMDKFYSCRWAIGGIISKRTWASTSAMKSALNTYLDCTAYNHAYYNQLHYCTVEKTHFVLRCVSTYLQGKTTHYRMRLQPVNVFGPRIINETDDAETTEMKIVPACIDNTDAQHGDLIFVECGTLDNETDNVADVDKNQPRVVNALKVGEKEQKEEFYDKLYVAFWTGNAQRYFPLFPHPVVDKIEVRPDNTILTHACSMRLTESKTHPISSLKHPIDQTQKFTFSFLRDTIPDVRSIFLIHGKKYLAEKISCSFTENGMSSLLKMTCYRMTT